MAICTNCGKKYSRLATPVSARRVCSECFFAQLEGETNADDPGAAGKPSGAQSRPRMAKEHSNAKPTPRRATFWTGSFSFRPSKKRSIGKTPLICYKMAHHALPYALFQRFTPTVHQWIHGQIGYDFFRYIATIEIEDLAIREANCAAFRAMNAFPVQAEEFGETGVYLSLKYPDHARISAEPGTIVGDMARGPLLRGPLYSIATVVDSAVEQTNYYVIEQSIGDQTRLLRVDKFGREVDLGVGPAPAPSLIKAMILELERDERAGKVKSRQPDRVSGIPDEEVTKDERYFGRVLGLSGKISKADITNRYKQLIAKYHPDKVLHLGTEFQQMAEQKTKQINEAYEFFRRKYF